MSMVDALAEKASQLTGSQFEVIRVPTLKSQRYVIVVRRGEYTFRFGETNVGEAKSRLAMICDLVEMGFIQTTPEESEGVMIEAPYPNEDPR